MSVSGGTAFAFHSGGVADCAGCHSMHNTPAVGGAPATGGPMLLTGTDQSSTCLNCHASSATTLSYHVMTYPFAGGTNVATVPVNKTPGGDFSWLLLSFTNTRTAARRAIPVPAMATTSSPPTTACGKSGLHDGARRIVSLPAACYCNSCHDPHNKMRRDSTGAIEI